MFRIGGNTFYDKKNKIPMKIPEFKRFGIGLITEFRGIPNKFPNQVFKLDNSLLFCNSTFVFVLYSTASKLLVFLIIKGSTGADRHKLNSNGFVTSSGLSRSASMELSPIKTVSVKSRSLPEKVQGVSPFLRS